MCKVWLRSSGVIVVSLVLVFVVAGLCLASVPMTISYHGQLLDSVDAPLPDGKYFVEFGLFASSTDGEALWTEAISIEVSAGSFSTVLGLVNPLPIEAFEGNTWLEVRLNGSAMSGRTQIVGSAYAMRAAVAETVPDGSVTRSKLSADILAEITQPAKSEQISQTKIQSSRSKGIGKIGLLFLSSASVLNVKDYGATGNGSTDDRAAFQSTHDALPSNGGIIYVPGTTASYVIDGEVNITKPNVRVVGDGIDITTIKRDGSSTGSYGGVFKILGLQPANFHIEDLTVNLSRSSYTNATLNSAVFSLRSTHVYADGVKVINSSENAFKFRNSAHGYVSRCYMENIYNVGVEFNFCDPSVDGYSGGASVPTYTTYVTKDCFFKDIDDGLNGAGNGCGVLLGGGPANMRPKGLLVQNNIFENNLRDIWEELNDSGAYLDEGVISGNISYNSKQGSIGIVSAKGCIISDNTIKDPGTSGPRGAGNDVFGIIASSSAETSTNNIISGNIIRDTRSSATDYAEQGIIARGGTISILNNVVEAGNKAAIQVEYIGGRCVIGNNILRGVTTPTAEKGLNFGTGNLSGKFVLGPNVIEGFTNNYYGLSNVTWYGTEYQSAGRFISSASIGDGPAIKKHLTAAVTWNPPSLSNGSVTSTTVTVTGAIVGDVAFAGLDTIGANNVEISAHVQATNTVRVVLRNSTGGTLDIANGNLRVNVWQY